MILDMEVGRSISLTIFLSSLLLVLPILANPGKNHDQYDECSEEKFCSHNGPAVRFPFVLLNRSECYGYNASYNLECDELNRTILRLPSSSAKVVVTNISYLTQTMEIQSAESCFAKQLRHLGVSKTPFQYYISNQDRGILRYSMFDCSTVSASNAYAYPGLRCLGTHVNLVPVETNTRLKGLAWALQSCTKMHDTERIPRDILDGLNSTRLSWSLPKCGRCEVRGGRCKWKNRNTNQIGCSLVDKGASGILKISRVIGPIIGCFLLVPAIAAMFFVYSKMEEQMENQQRIKKFLDDYSAMKPTRYSYADIKKFTKNFKEKLGEGSYGNVFKGKISNKIFVAVKLLHSSTRDGEEFIDEVGTIGTIHHVNVVRLLGFCADGYKRALVYEFLSNGSLDKFIFSERQKQQTLGIGKLHNIAIGIARGIEYLHQGCEQRILHFDIKPHNILMDENYNPKISDFGLAKLCEKGKSAVTMTNARGTMGYIAPEVFSRQFGNVSYKSDVYSFGMLLLEMIGRRKNIDTSVENTSQVYFPEWIYKRLVNGDELRIQIEEDGEDEIVKRLAIVALRCIQWNPVDRPSITYVLQELEGSGDYLSLPSDPFTSSIARTLAGPIEQGSTISSALTMISESE